MLFNLPTSAALFCCLLSLCALADTKTILLFGQSGVGKTITLNALYNAALFASTPVNSVETLRFIAPLRRSLTEQTPWSCDSLDSVSSSIYGRISVPIGAHKQAGGSDTRDFIGYRFTPRSSGWPAGTLLEIIDMPGIDDTASTAYDPNSTHLQIIREIEQQIKQRSHSLSAILIVVDNKLARVDDQACMVMDAIHQILTPEIVERTFILFNRFRADEGRNSYVQEMLTEHLSVDQGMVQVPSENYINEDPIYLAEFNDYRYGFVDARKYQTIREETETNLRDLLRRIGQFEVPIPLQGYPEYRAYQNQMAQHLCEMVGPQLEIEKRLILCKKIALEIDDANTTLNIIKRKKMQKAQWFGLTTMLTVPFVHPIISVASVVGRGVTKMHRQDAGGALKQKIGQYTQTYDALQAKINDYEYRKKQHLMLY